MRRDVVRHPGSVVVMAVDDAREPWRILLIRQFRYAAARELWELPAGRIDEGEQTLAAAKRELLEETGITAQRWKKALHSSLSPGFLDETMALYLARGPEQGKAQPEEDEVIQARFFPLSLAVKMVMSGKIHGRQDHCRRALAGEVLSPGPLKPFPRLAGFRQHRPALLGPPNSLAGSAVDQW